MAPDQPTEAEYEAARDDLRTRLKAQRTRNQKKYRSILAQGAVPGSASILSARLEALVDMLLSPDARLAFELEFEGRLEGVLNECLADLRQQALVAKDPNTRPSGLVMPG